ncbi:MAG: hypothetical protein H6953_14760 [Chromatiaceae bacterium]|nr:hypothetical protein [Gammaproteobacteria bacterium]MCP5306702.1 hypothetical protein [Chromatiaceae bacterium]MCP5421796.1 hypothetical protein [Chromatiaceae bacterium]
MKIESATVALAAFHNETQIQQETERLDIWRSGGRGENRGVRAHGPGQGLAIGHTRRGHGHHHHAHGVRHGDRVHLSDEARNLDVRKGELSGEDVSDGMTSQESFRTSVVKLMVEKITGRSIATVDPADLQPDAEAGTPIDPNAVGETDAGTPAETDAPRGFGLRYEYRAVQYESEQLSFSAEGVAKTADGREISFNVSLNMSREFYSETAVTFEAGRKLHDPLVLNFDGNAAELTERDFTFDIDSDGHADQVAFVGEGSGFLALDRNGDGEINDGSELFGPTTGDGFAELASYDSDQNNWIDENDPIYADLRIWSRAQDGSTSLLALGLQGVGAIYLGRVASPFTVKDDANQDLGQVRNSGIFLNEDGSVGTLQQVDLVV